MKQKFAKTVQKMKVSKQEFTIVCTAEQRLESEKQISIATQHPFIDKRKYATLYFLPNGSKIVLIHEKLIGPLFKQSIDMDMREFTAKELSDYFTRR